MPYLSLVFRAHNASLREYCILWWKDDVEMFHLKAKLHTWGLVDKIWIQLWCFYYIFLRPHTCQNLCMHVQMFFAVLLYNNRLDWKLDFWRKCKCCWLCKTRHHDARVLWMVAKTKNDCLQVTLNAFCAPSWLFRICTTVLQLVFFNVFERSLVLTKAAFIW